jgi:hypothetical protein
MDRRNCPCLVSLALVVALSGVGTPSNEAQKVLKHPGRVVEMGVNRPVHVAVKAWPESTPTGREEDCPLYGREPLDSTSSNPKDGGFLLRIDKAKRTYTTTYCASGFYPRADRDIPNRVDGSPVQPNPVEMVSRTSDRKAYESLVRRKTTAFLNDLVYLESISPGTFYEALATLASDIGADFPARQKALYTVRELVFEWGKGDVPKK